MLGKGETPVELNRLEMETKAGRQTVLRESTTISKVIVQCRVSLLSLRVGIVRQQCLLCLPLHHTLPQPALTLDLGDFAEWILAFYQTQK